MWLSTFMPRSRNEVVLLLQLLCTLPGHHISVRAHVCEVGRERDHHNIWRWVLQYAKPCSCTRIRMGGMNTRTLVRPFKPAYANELLITTDINKIRNHYGLRCKDTEAPNFQGSCPNTTIEVTDDGKSTRLVVWEALSAIDNSGLVPNVTCNPRSGSNFTIGQTQVVCKAIDQSGNTEHCTFDVNIRDMEAPIFQGSCTNNITAETDPGESTALVVWEEPSAIDNSRSIPNVTCNPRSFSKFSIGLTQVVCEAMDQSGNTAICTFDVNITDTEAPNFQRSCPNNTVAETDPGSSTALVIWEAPPAIDNSRKVLNVTCNPKTSVFSIGRTPVVCQAVDESGNTATCTFDVNIMDVEAPLVESCVTNLAQESDSAATAATVMWQRPLVTDNSGNVTNIECNPASGSTFFLGQNQVQCEATDKSGNKAVWDFYVYVVGLSTACVNCDGSHTATYTAQSCQHLLEACPLVPSGVYYLQRSGTLYKVFCDMDSIKGGWARFGKSVTGSEWNYHDEDKETITLDIISDSDIVLMKSMQFTDFKILTDVKFRLQADDSVNPSSLSVYFLPSLSAGEMRIDVFADNTFLEFVEEGNYIECKSTSNHHRCGQGGTPARGTRSQQLLIRSASFGPQADGASAKYNQWSRNRYTWSGTYYYVLAK